MAPLLTGPPVGREALVVFTGRAVLTWLRVLKPGFRHCFLFVRDDPYWIQCNPMAHETALLLHTEAEMDWLVERLSGAEGCTIVKTATRAAPRRAAPWRPFTCVEAVKRGLGLQEKGIWTPWQLYRFLIKYP
jgi:hypothetical protein